MTVREADATPAGGRLANVGTREASAGQARAASPGGVPFAPDHCVGQTRVGHACTARPAMGTEYCAGHLRSRGEL